LGTNRDHSGVNPKVREDLPLEPGWAAIGKALSTNGNVTMVI
jgi:hypothetical protein